MSTVEKKARKARSLKLSLTDWLGQLLGDVKDDDGVGQDDGLERRGKLIVWVSEDLQITDSIQIRNQ